MGNVSLRQVKYMDGIYNNGEYLARNPTWHAHDSAWKAAKILELLDRNGVRPKKVLEIGCGAGEILRCLAQELPPEVEFRGVEVSPQAYRLAKRQASERLQFCLGDPFEHVEQDFDLVLVIDVFEHVDDYIGFLKRVRNLHGHKIFHIPLDLSLQSVLRVTPIMKLRSMVGHLHHFTKEIALATLQDTQHEIVDWFYTAGAVEKPKSWKAKLMGLPRRLAFGVSQDLAVRTLGGYSLIVLAK